MPADHEDYELKILMRQNQFFGPFPESYREIANDDVLRILEYVMINVPPQKMKPFQYITEREVCKEDKIFLQKIMKLDPRDRPTAKQIAEDEWMASGNQQDCVTLLESGPCKAPKSTRLSWQRWN